MSEKEHDKIVGATCISCDVTNLCEGDQVHRHMVLTNAYTGLPKESVMCGECIANFVTYLFLNVSPVCTVFEDWLTSKVLVKEVMEAKSE